MADDRLDLGLVDSIEATDVGEPGQRTFHITVDSERGSATVWMEKEQLFQIGMVIKQFLALHDAVDDPRQYSPQQSTPSTPQSVEFKASELQVRYEPGTMAFTIEATDPENEQENDFEEPAVTVQFSFLREAGNRMADEALTAVSRGRPRCELCGGPKSDDHVCPRSNGHHKGDFELA